MGNMPHFNTLQDKPNLVSTVSLDTCCIYIYNIYIYIHSHSIEWRNLTPHISAPCPSNTIFARLLRESNCAATPVDVILAQGIPRCVIYLGYLSAKAAEASVASCGNFLRLGIVSSRILNFQNGRV